MYVSVQVHVCSYQDNALYRDKSLKELLQKVQLNVGVNSGFAPILPIVIALNLRVKN